MPEWPRAYQEQARTSEETTAAHNTAKQLRENIVEFLNVNGKKHPYYADRALDGLWATIGLSSLVYPELWYLGVLSGVLMAKRVTDLQTLHHLPQRWLDETSSTWAGKYIGEENDAVILYANDGVPSKATKIQIGTFHGTELLNLRFNEALLACTEQDPRFKSIEPTRNFHGTKFNGERLKHIREATVEDVQKYDEYLTYMRNPHISRPFVQFGRLPLLRGFS